MNRINFRRAVILMMWSPFSVMAGVLLGTAVVEGHIFLMGLVMNAAPAGF